MCWRKQMEVEVVPKVCLLQLSSLPSHCHVLSIGIMSHPMYFMLPKELFGSLISLFISGLGTPPKLKTDTISRSPVAYQFLRCCPPGLGRSAKITWKLWLVQPPVHFIFVLSSFPFEFWVVLWKGGNHGKGLEAAMLGHSLSGVCMIQNISFYIFSLIGCPDYNFYHICGYFYKARVHLLCLFEYFFLFPPYGCSTNLFMKYFFIILLICNSTVDQKYKNKFVHFKDIKN